RDSRLPAEHRVQDDHGLALDDEADALLVLDGRTPLVLAEQQPGARARTGEVYAMRDLVVELTPGEHYTANRLWRSARLTEAGKREVNFRGLTEQQRRDLNAALQAEAREVGRDYTANGVILPVHRDLGLQLRHNRFSKGLQEALAAKHDLLIEAEHQTVAILTRADHMALYDDVFGMTGTAMEARDFFDQYGLDVVPFHPPGHVGPQPLGKPRNYLTEGGKAAAMAVDAATIAEDQPVLVSYPDIVDSRAFATRMSHGGREPAQLDAATPPGEAKQVVDGIGRKNAVTVAGNRAGRGVDVRLGGKGATPAEIAEVNEAGGLHVMTSEQPEMPGVKKQTNSRAARKRTETENDNGSSQEYRSLNDSFLYKFAPHAEHRALLEKYRDHDDANGPIEDPAIDRLFAAADRNSLRYNLRLFKQTLRHPERADIVNMTVSKVRSAETSEAAATTPLGTAEARLRQAQEAADEIARAIDAEFAAGEGYNRGNSRDQCGALCQARAELENARQEYLQIVHENAQPYRIRTRSETASATRDTGSTDRRGRTGGTATDRTGSDGQAVVADARSPAKSSSPKSEPMTAAGMGVSLAAVAAAQNDDDRRSAMVTLQRLAEHAVHVVGVDGKAWMLSESTQHTARRIISILQRQDRAGQPGTATSVDPGVRSAASLEQDELRALFGLLDGQVANLPAGAMESPWLHEFRDQLAADRAAEEAAAKTTEKNQEELRVRLGGDQETLRAILIVARLWLLTRLIAELHGKEPSTEGVERLWLADLNTQTLRLLLDYARGHSLARISADYPQPDGTDPLLSDEMHGTQLIEDMWRALAAADGRPVITEASARAAARAQHGSDEPGAWQTVLSTLPDLYTERSPIERQLFWNHPKEFIEHLIDHLPNGVRDRVYAALTGGKPYIIATVAELAALSGEDLAAIGSSLGEDVIVSIRRAIVLHQVELAGQPNSGQASSNGYTPASSAPPNPPGAPPAGDEPPLDPSAGRDPASGTGYEPSAIDMPRARSPPVSLYRQLAATAIFVAGAVAYSLAAVQLTVLGLAPLSVFALASPILLVTLGLLYLTQERRAATAVDDARRDNLGQQALGGGYSVAAAVRAGSSTGPAGVVRRAGATYPRITAGLIAANVALFAAPAVLGLAAPLVAWGALNPAQFHGWQVLTAAFLHVGLIHVAINMLSLAQFGAPLERLLGRARFVALYAAGILGSSAAALLSPSALPVVGASGAIFGLLGAAVVLARRAGISIRQFLPALAVIAAFQVYAALALPVSLAAHLGGLVAGVVAALAITRFWPAPVSTPVKRDGNDSDDALAPPEVTGRRVYNGDLTVDV
ncbi:MAG: secA, partial [Pseudonocardia sp.]|nr:secA [Pseudonocardia sp.]